MYTYYNNGIYNPFKELGFLIQNNYHSILHPLQSIAIGNGNQQKTNSYGNQQRTNSYRNQQRTNSNGNQDEFTYPDMLGIQRRR